MRVFLPVALRNSDLVYRLQDPSPQLLINAQNGHSFKHAAVDDDTGYLYMWSSETSIETLQIWRLGSAKEDLNIAFDSAQNYHAVRYLAFFYYSALI